MSREDDRNATPVSFLDVIACAFGAIVLLVLILPVEQLGVLADSEPLNIDYGQLDLDSQTLDDEIEALTREIEQNRQILKQIGNQSASKDAQSTEYRNAITSTTTELERLRGNTTATQLARERLQAKTERSASITQADYAGIPVDSEYVAFVVDTSGSMKSIWPQVIREVEGVLSLYPAMKGFQILSDNGKYLYEPYRQRWMQDSPQLRQRVVDRLRRWRARSNSSPDGGITVALQDLYDPTKKIAIFIFGDDFADETDLDEYILGIDRMVNDANVAQGSLRIHAFGFESNSTVSSLRFSILMRELTQRHGGAFLALPLIEAHLMTSGS